MRSRPSQQPRYQRYASEGKTPLPSLAHLKRVGLLHGVVSISTPLQVKTQLHEMKQKLSQSQHTVRLREDTIQDLQKKLAAEADKVWDTISN